jgi:hypothetical protein
MRAHGVSMKNIHTKLHKYLNLSKKLARWVPKLLNDDMKKEQAQTNKEFLMMVRRHLMSIWTTLSPWRSQQCPSIQMKPSSRAKIGW